MVLVPLTQGYSACIDDIDYAAVTAIGKWCYADGYAVHYYTDDQGRRQRLFMHRFILQRMLGHNIPAGMQCDHINGPQLGKDARRENSRANLRLASRSEQQANKGSQVNSSIDGCKGISLRAGKYQVRLRHCGLRLSLGNYDTLNMAQSVYGFAHRVLWGEFTTEALVPAPSPELQDYVLNTLMRYGVEVDLSVQ